MRCGCGSTSSCDCVLVGGDGVTITGAGTVVAPYVVTAEEFFTEPNGCIDPTGLIINPISSTCLLCTPEGLTLVLDPEGGVSCGPDGLMSEGVEPPIQEQFAALDSPGVLVVSTGVSRLRFPFAATIISVTAAVNTAPTGAAIIADVNKNGTTIFTTPGNRPTISIGGFATTTEPTPDVTSVSAGDYLTVDIDQVGSTIAGADLTVVIRYIPTDLASGQFTVFDSPGVLVVSTGTGRLRFPFSATIISVTAEVNTAPTGASIIVDVNKNGATIFSTIGNRPTIGIGNFATTSEPTPNITAVAAGDYLTVDIDQVGSTIAGADLTVVIRYLPV